MGASRLVTLVGLVIVTVAVLSIGWEFLLEPFVSPAVTGDADAEGDATKWEFVVTSVIVATLALAVPTAIAFDAENAAAERQEELRESEERYRSLVELSPTAILVHKRGEIVYANRAAKDMFQARETSDLLGIGILCLVHPDHQETAARRLKSLWEGEENLPVTEMRLIRLDGDPIHVSLASGATTFQGSPAQQSVIRDISERKRAEEALENFARFQQTLIDNIPVPLFFKDVSGHYLGCNHAFSEFLGRGKEEIVGRTVFDLAPKDLAETYLAADKELFAAGGIQTYESRVRHSSGAYQDVIFYKATFDDTEGKIAGLVGTILDITERKENEEALRKSRESLTNAQRMAHIGNWDWNVEADHLAWSEEIYRIFGVEPDEFTASYKGFLELVHPEDRAEVGIAVRAALDCKAPYAMDHRIIRPDGTQRIVHEQAEVVLDGAGNAIAMTGTVQDVTELKMAERDLRKAMEQAEFASRAKTEFLANMSHELRTPLNSVIGFSDLMMAEAFGPIGNAQYAEYAKDINDSGKHLLDLINDLLDIARIETGEMRIYERDVDVVPAVEACHRIVRERAQQAGIELVFDLSDGLPVLHCDERQLKQILLNLLSNAIKFTEGGGTVTLSVSVDEPGRYTFVVSDTGIGIAPEDIETALSTFGQADGSLARRYEGTGLGLPLSRRFAELHGGELILESELGKGTTVTVRFPKVRVVEAAS